MPPLEDDEECDDLSDAAAEFSGSEDDEENGDDHVGSLPSFSDEETKTRFTNYSMSSSVIRRNQGLTLVDDKFEQVYQSKTKKLVKVNWYDIIPQCYVIINTVFVFSSNC